MKRVLVACALTAATAGMLYASLVLAPEWLTRHDLDYIASYSKANQAHARELLDADRAKVVQLTLGITILWTAYAAWRKLRLDARSTDLAEDKLRIDEEARRYERLGEAISRLGNESAAIRRAAVTDLGSLMREADAIDRALAYQISILLGNAAVESSKREPRPTTVPGEIEASFEAYEGLEADSQLWLDLQHGKFRGWTLSLPSRQEVDLRHADLRNAHIDGLGTYIRLEGARRDGLVLGQGVEVVD